VQAPGGRVDQQRQRIHISALELGELPVGQHLAHDFVLRGQFVEHVGGGGEGFPLGLLGRGQLQIHEQHASQLLRGADVERLACQHVDLGGELRDFRLHDPGEALQLYGVDAYARALHARQHAGQGQFDFVVEPAQAAGIDRRR